MLLRRHGSGEVVDSRSLGQMLELLKSHDVYERLFARDALCLHVDAKLLSTSIGPIISLLDEPDTLARRTGLHLLSQLRPAALLLAVLPRVIGLLGDADGEVRRAVLPVLKALPPDALADEAHAAQLVAYLHPGLDWQVRATALYGLAALPPARLAEELEEAMACALVETEPSGMRIAALDVLQSLIEGLAGARKRAGSEDDGDTQQQQQQQQQDQQQHQQQQEEEPQQELATTTPPANCPLAAALLAQAPRVVERFQDVDDRFVRWKAMSVVGSYPPSLLQRRPEVLAAVLGCLDHPYACTRGAGLLALGRLDPLLLAPDVLRAMAARLRDEEAAVRWACVHALKKQLAAVCASAEVAALVAGEAAARLAEEGEDPWVQREAHRLLSQLPEAAVGAEAAEARRAFELRSEEVVDEVMEEAAAIDTVVGMGGGGGGGGQRPD